MPRSLILYGTKFIADLGRILEDQEKFLSDGGSDINDVPSLKNLSISFVTTFDSREGLRPTDHGQEVADS
jgi:hypothetical protein